MESTWPKEMFKELKVLTLEQASNEKGCSIRTVQRTFAKLSVIRSYNKNSRYYTLSDIPDFNNHGIWPYRSILFSRYGTLKQTVKHLILVSNSGLSGNEIGEIVRLSPRSFMHHFKEMEGIFREKHEGVYVYFSAEAKTFADQNSNRIGAVNARKLDDTVVIKILVEYIKHPEKSTQELATILKDWRSCRVSAFQIENLFAHHGLLKKTQDSRR